MKWLGKSLKTWTIDLKISFSIRRCQRKWRRWRKVVYLTILITATKLRVGHRHRLWFALRSIVQRTAHWEFLIFIYLFIGAFNYGQLIRYPLKLMTWQPTYEKGVLELNGSIQLTLSWIFAMQRSGNLHKGTLVDHCFITLLFLFSWP